jgi:hypothetical protein
MSDLKTEGRDLFANLKPEKESLGHAAAMAIPRIGKDLIESAYGAIQKAPEYWESAKTEVPGFLNPINYMLHPIERGKQTLAGLLQAGQNINQLPKNIAQYAANRLNLIPEDWANKVPTAPDITEGIDYYLGKPNKPGDELARGISRNALGIIPAAKIASALNPLNLTAKNIAKDVLKTREKNIGQYGRHYQDLWNEAKNKGFEDALYDIEMDLPTIKKYSPGKSIEGVNEFNNNPTLESAHNAKSDLLRIQRELNKKTSLNRAESKHLTAVNNAIDSINKNMFKEQGGGINKTLKAKYEKIQSGYKNEVVPYNNKAIKVYLRGESVPEELVNSLSRGAFNAKRGKYHKAIKYRKMAQKHPFLSGLGIGGAGGASALLLNKLFNKE